MDVAWSAARAIDPADSSVLRGDPAEFMSRLTALVNELKFVFERMGIDVWKVIEAANTKPFGLMAFYPGPGLGGHWTETIAAGWNRLWSVDQFVTPRRETEDYGRGEAAKRICAVVAGRAP